MKPDELKQIVKEKYGDIAKQVNLKNQASCCEKSCDCGETTFTVMNDEYRYLEGYAPDADLQLGCGLPTKFAGIKKGNAVLDLGSGAGNDCFVARALTGPEGKITGLDFTDAMLEKARAIAAKLNYSNVGFVKGDIEEIPLPSESYDVVISNCVLNLVPDKKKAFAEIYRVLKPGGHFCISDIVLLGELPEALKADAALYAGCVSGALPKEKYLEIIKNSGFINIQIQKERRVDLPDDILMKYLDPFELNTYKQGGHGIFSLTMTAGKQPSAA